MSFYLAFTRDEMQLISFPLHLQKHLQIMMFKRISTIKHPFTPLLWRIFSVCTNQQANTCSRIISAAILTCFPFKSTFQESFSSPRLSCLKLLINHQLSSQHRLEYVLFNWLYATLPVCFLSCSLAGFVNITHQNHDTSSHSGKMRGQREKGGETLM